MQILTGSAYMYFTWLQDIVSLDYEVCAHS